MPLNSLTYSPLSVQQSYEGLYDYKIIVSNNILKKYVQQIEQIDQLNMKPEIDISINTRIYCEMLNNKGERVYWFAIMAFGEKMMVNGIVVENNKLFYDLIQYFLPSSERESYMRIIDNKFK